MGKIPVYHRKTLGATSCGKKLLFEVLGEAPITFSQLKPRIEKSQNGDGPIHSNPDPLHAGAPPRARGAFSLVQVDQVPERKLTLQASHAIRNLVR
jgi:hypothetical protein